MRKQFFAIMLALLAASLLLGDVARAQTVSGVISGRVVDASGQSIPGAEVTLTNDLTGETRAFITEDAGDFIFTSVQPGKFTLSVRARGFKNFQKTNLVLTASERLSAGHLELEVGAGDESVTVVAGATPLQTTSQERSALLNDAHIATLLTRGRDVMHLIRLLPGVVNDGSSGESLGSQAAPTINGVRNEYNSVSVDGVAGNPRGGKTLDSPLNLDAIAEVKVLQSNFQAEYGKSAGASINLVTKSGARDFHGSAYYYKRHEQFNANTFFNNLNGLKKSPYRYNTIGYNLGGPVYWPGKFNNNKDRLFFFFSQEFLPNKRPGGLRTYTVPTALERRGDFSQTRDVSGRKIWIKDPSERGRCDAVDQTACFPDNIIPPDRINPDMQRLLNVFPLPNFFDRNISKGAYNLVIADAVEAPVRQEVARIDFNISSKWHTYARVTNMSSDSRGLSTAANRMPWGPAPLGYQTPSRSFGVNVTYVASPTVVNEFVIGMTSWYETQRFVHPEDVAKLQRAKLGVRVGQFNPQNNPLGLVPAITFGPSNSSDVRNAAVIDYDGRFPMNNSVVSLSIADGISKAWRRHNFKAGIALEGAEYLQAHSSGGSSFVGRFDFRRNTQNPFDTNYAYANALLGYFHSYAEATARPNYQPRTKVVEWYMQDNWKIRDRLTLDYGVRFTASIPQISASGQAATFVMDRYDRSKVPLLYQPACRSGQIPCPIQDRRARHPVTGELIEAVFIGAFVPGSGDPANGSVTATDPTYPHALTRGQGLVAAPRVGFAYDVFGNGKTALRGGFGIFYNARAGSGQLGDATFNPPILFNPTQYYGNVQTFLSTSGVLFPSSVARALEPKSHMPEVYSMSLGIQRDIGFQTVVDIAYVSTLGRHLGQSRNINLVPYGARFRPENQDPTQRGKPLPDDFFRPIPGYGNISYLEFASTSNYHALQAQVNRRFSGGLQFGASWTWSKAMDFTDAVYGAVATYAPRRAWNYGKANFDRTHNLTINWLWQMPKASRWLGNWSAVRAVLDNWQMSGIASFVSGEPRGITFSISTEDEEDAGSITGGGDGARVVRMGEAVLPRGQRTFRRFFNTDVFARPAVGTTGNAPKDVYRRPGVNNWDLAFIKNIPITEKLVLQFRGEMYNAFNHTQFNEVDEAARFNAAGKQTNGRFGQVTSARDPRRVQFALRLTF